MPLERDIEPASPPGNLATSANQQVLVEERRGKVSILMLNRPDARNSLSTGLITALHTAIERLGKSAATAALVITGAPPAFCSGHDLKEMTAHRSGPDRGRAFFEQTMTACSALMQAIVRCPKPVIAAVNGMASAAGCQLVASCDLAVASSEARFATPGVNIGLFCSTPMVALSRSVTRKAAMEMLLLGEAVDAASAKEMGLVNRVCAPGDVLAEALAFANVIAEKSPMGLAIGKEAFARQLDMPLSEAYAYTSRVMVENMLTRDAEEGIGAFLGKRQPDWQGT